MSEAFDPKLRQMFLGGMSHAACTVNIVTTDGKAGRAGVTVSAMSSVSADTPRPTLLVCVHHQSPAAQKIIDNGVFCVNVLKDDQAYISDTFAGRFKNQIADKFDCAEWKEMPSGAPRVVDPLVGFDCKILSSNLIGTHLVFFGEVGDIFIAERGSPLIYANRAYGATNRIDAAGSINAGRDAAAAALSIGCFHTFGPYILPEMISRLRNSDPELKINLIEGDQRRVQESLSAGEVELAFLYDIGLGDDFVTEPLTHLTPYVLLADGHPLAAKTALAPSDLADQPMILLNAPPSRDYFTGILTAAGVTPNIAFKSSSFEMVRGMVGHGLGYSLLATKPASSMTYDGKALITRPLVGETEPSRVVLAMRKGTKPSPTAERFMWFCRDFFCLDP
ncbi:MAG: LysR substrate-binding domain-containing protein [Paracoccaceae bacterium]|jgi:flavin reductase (DIM6/NTAB) family NADH-FMN oxidoreductase RutF|nr:LysR substrate-binding domain-containing protein [Paracoccaceae bacterium]